MPQTTTLTGNGLTPTTTPGFDKSNSRAIEICDRLAEKTSPDVRKAMTDIYFTCTRMEWMFWESAYSGEGWKI